MCIFPSFTHLGSYVYRPHCYLGYRFRSQLKYSLENIGLGVFRVFQHVGGNGYAFSFLYVIVLWFWPSRSLLVWSKLGTCGTWCNSRCNRSNANLLVSAIHCYKTLTNYSNNETIVNLGSVIYKLSYKGCSFLPLTALTQTSHHQTKFAQFNTWSNYFTTNSNYIIAELWSSTWSVRS